MGRLLQRERTMMSGSPAMRKASDRVVSALVLIEVTLATMLVSHGMTAVSRAWRLARTPAGFDSSQGVVLEVHPPTDAYPTVREVLRLTNAIRAKAAALPGVDFVGWSAGLPTGRGFRMPFLRADGSSEFITFAPVSPGGNEAKGVRLLAGRTIGEQDGPEAPRVALVNEAYLRRFGSRGLGDRLRPAGVNSRDAGIVGIVADTRRDESNADTPVAYVPLAQVDPRVLALVRQLQPLYLVIKGPGAARAGRLMPAIVGSIAPSLALSAPESLGRIADAPLAGARRDVVLFATLSGLAVGLAAVGQYSVHSVEVAASRHTMSLRMALGATPRQLRVHVFRKALSVALGGILLGLLGTGFVQWCFSPGMAVRVGADIGESVAAALVMALATMVAVAAPAHRAAAIEPWRVLRSD